MLRVAEEFGVRVATLQHILEGYKVADEIAKHGAGASTFSDWWAYKVEVYDAIPYNGALMRERGVVVSFNSDSDELARRLNCGGGEGGQVRRRAAGRRARLRDDQPGETARHREARRLARARARTRDFVIWSGDPLSAESVALETWIEGKKYFDRAADLARRPALDQEKADLIEKAKKVLDADKKSKPGAGTEKPAERRSRPRARCGSQIAPTPIPHLGPTPTPAPERKRAA